MRYKASLIGAIALSTSCLLYAEDTNEFSIEDRGALHWLWDFAQAHRSPLYLEEPQSTTWLNGTFLSGGVLWGQVNDETKLFAVVGNDFDDGIGPSIIDNQVVPYYFLNDYKFGFQLCSGITLGAVNIGLDYSNIRSGFNNTLQIEQSTAASFVKTTILIQTPSLTVPEVFIVLPPDFLMTLTAISDITYETFDIFFQTKQWAFTQKSRMKFQPMMGLRIISYKKTIRISGLEIEPGVQTIPFDSVLYGRILAKAPFLSLDAKCFFSNNFYFYNGLLYGIVVGRQSIGGQVVHAHCLV